MTMFSQSVKVTFNDREIEVFEGWTGAFRGHSNAVIRWIHVVVAVLEKTGVRDSADRYELRLQNGARLAQNAVVPFPPPKAFMVARAGVGE